MWSLGTTPAIFLFIGVIIGLAFVVGALLSHWSNRGKDKFL